MSSSPSSARGALALRAGCAGTGKEHCRHRRGCPAAPSFRVCHARSSCTSRSQPRQRCMPVALRYGSRHTPFLPQATGPVVVPARDPPASGKGGAGTPHT